MAGFVAAALLVNACGGGSGSSSNAAAESGPSEGGIAANQPATVSAPGTSQGPSCGLALPSQPVDITAQILANGGENPIVLQGANYVINLPGDARVPSPPDSDSLPDVPNVPTTYYHGVISGTGTLTVKAPPGSSARLILSNRSTFSLPPARQLQYTVKQSYTRPTLYDGVPFDNWTSPVYVSHNVNEPAVFLDTGAQLQLGTSLRLPPDGKPPEIFSNASSRPTEANAAANFVNIQINGLLVTNNVADNGQGSSFIHLGAVSGCGDVIVNNTPDNQKVGGGSISFSGNSTYTGKSLFYATNVGDASNFGAVPNTKVIFNRFVLTYSTPIATNYYNDVGNILPQAPSGDASYVAAPGVLKVTSDIYEAHHGNSVHNIGRGGVSVFSGRYSYSDSDDQLNPSLSDPRLDFTGFNGNAAHRIFYLHGGSITQFGDGTSDNPFVKGNEVTVTLNAGGSALGLFYRGVVPFNIPINSPTNPSNTQLFIVGAAGQPPNHVILTQPNYYYGATRIDANAILQLGDGTQGNETALSVKPVAGQSRTTPGTYSTSNGNGSILSPGTTDGTGKNEAIVGKSSNVIVNNGQLIVNNVPGARSGISQTRMAGISGTGSVTQMGSLPLTLLAGNSYSGGTTITAGMLYVAGSDALGRGPVANNGSLAAADAQHTIGIAAGYAQGAAGQLALRLGGTAPGFNQDQLQVVGKATLNGTLVLSLADGFVPAVGQTFKLVQADGGLEGRFGTVSAGALKVSVSYDAKAAYATVMP